MSFELNQIVPSLERHPEARFLGTVNARRGELSFAEMHRHVYSAASLLRDRGIGPGAHVGLYARNSLAWLVAELACLALGAVTIPFDRGEDWGEAPRMIADWDLELLVTDAWPAGDRVMEAEAFLSLEAGAVRAHCYGPNDVSTVKFSSGSSATPKAVRARAAHFDHMARHIAAMFPTGPGDLLLVIAPLSTWLQRFMVHLSILSGTDVALARPEMAVNALETERPTLVIAVPRLLEAVHMVHRQRRELGSPDSLPDLWGGRLRYLWTGSAPIDRAILEAYLDAGIPLFEGYGMTETGMIAKNYPGNRRAGSVGRIFPGTKLAFDPNGQILVQSEFHANTHYWRGEGDAFWPGGWVATGDVGRLDEDGYLYLDGRLTETIVLSNGRKVFPGALEGILRADPAIADCAVTCQDGSRLVAAIRTADPDLPDSEVAGLLAAAAQAEPAHRRVLDFVRVDRLVFEKEFRTANGKLKRAAVAEHVARRLAGPNG
jgi:long-chain acyl-CoA synthetase